MKAILFVTLLFTDNGLLEMEMEVSDMATCKKYGQHFVNKNIKLPDVVSAEYSCKDK